MKKMIFTAMAVLAFSAVSMANTIELKEDIAEVVISEEVTVTKKVIPAIDVCAILAIATYLDLEANGDHFTTCATEAEGVYFACKTGQL